MQTKLTSARTIQVLWNSVFRHSKAFFAFALLSSSVYAFMVIPFWLQKAYLDEVGSFLNGNSTISTLIASLLILYLARSITGGFLVPFGQAKDLYYEYMVTRNVSLSQHEIGNKILLEYYESAPMFNLMNRAKIALTSGALREIINSIGASLTLVINLLAMAGSLWIIDPLFALISLVSVLPVFVERVIFATKFVEMQKQISEKRRRQEQCIRHIVDKEFALETRISGAAKFFAAKWEEYRQDIERQEMGLQTYRLKAELLLNLGKSACVVLVITLAALGLSQGVLTVGAFIAVIGILGVMHASTSFFVNMISGAYSQYVELADVVRYYELEKQNESGVSISSVGDITLEDVSYKYPSRQTYAVRNVSKRFRRGEKVAILGVNGAGKTTLANMLLALHKPTGGAVYYGDQDVSTLNKAAVYSKMSAVFQNFGIYNLSIRNNVSFGKSEEPGRGDDVYRSLVQAGFEVEKCADGLETFIGKEFDGVELSRGQAQQVAIARAYYNRQADLIVIDEPTAALDPLAEERLYQEFLGIARDKTTFMISHRLGSVRIADRILVMDAAEILEDGSHEELIKKNGLYAQMYRAQAALYER